MPLTNADREIIASIIAAALADFEERLGRKLREVVAAELDRRGYPLKVDLCRERERSVVMPLVGGWLPPVTPGAESGVPNS